MIARSNLKSGINAALLNQQQIDARFEIAPRDHTQRILPLIEELLLQNALSMIARSNLKSGINLLLIQQGGWTGFCRRIQRYSRPYGALFLNSLPPTPRTRDIARAIAFIRQQPDAW
jgi:hypothetical protein